MRQVQYTYYNTFEFDVSVLNYYTTIPHNVILQYYNKYLIREIYCTNRRQTLRISKGSIRANYLYTAQV